MSEISALLGEVFGTTKTASASEEDLQKEAHMQFFTDLCKEQNIDIGALDDNQVGELYKAAMAMYPANGTTKEAEFPPAAKSDEDKKKEEEEKKAKEKSAAASAEYAEKRAAAAKIAEADFMGRVMAHSLVDEMRKIAAEEGGKPPFPPKKPEGKDGKDGKDEDSEKKASDARAQALIDALRARTKEASAPPAGSSSTPNFDEQAAYHAIEMLKSAGVDADLAHARISAVYTLGIGDSTKIASAETEERARVLRGLEYCEAAGFQVDWSKA